MAKIIVIKTCADCPHCQTFGKEHQCDELSRMLRSPTLKIPKVCPLIDAPAVIVFKQNKNWKPEDGNFFDAVFSALEVNEVPAYLEEIKS